MKVVTSIIIMSTGDWFVGRYRVLTIYERGSFVTKAMVKRN
jgi:hypothetical protein